MRTRLSPNTDPKAKSIYTRTPVRMVPATASAIEAWAASWNESRQSGRVLSACEMQAMNVLQAEGVKIVKRLPKQAPPKATTYALPRPWGFIVAEQLSERAEIAVSLLWSAFKVRAAATALDELVVESVRVGMLSERIQVLPFEELIQLPSKRLQKGTQTTKENSLPRRKEFARRVHGICPEGKGVQKACKRVGDQWVKEHPDDAKLKPDSLREMIRKAYREFHPAKARQKRIITKT